LIIAGVIIAAVPAGAQDPGRRIRLRDVERATAGRAYKAATAPNSRTDSPKVKIRRDGRVSIANISGDIVVTAGSGDEVSIDAVKRTRGDRSELANVEILVEERAGRVDVRVEHGARERGRRSDSVSVDFTVTCRPRRPRRHSVSGSLKVTGSARGGPRRDRQRRRRPPTRRISSTPRASRATSR
jgi:hypothetical protein